MNRNILYLVIFSLVVVASALGYFYYQEQKTASGVNITVDDQGFSSHGGVGKRGHPDERTVEIFVSLTEEKDS